MSKDYTIGLDIGTHSVGWAVLTDDYQLIKKKMPVLGNSNTKYLKKNFWGATLFDEGLTAAATRGSRTARRRYTRRRNRIRYLQEIFTPEMQQLDPNFFFRLEESFLVGEDKLKERHPIFANLEEELAYHEEYPTIYHLRQALADGTEQADLRLVYLALAHIVKYRGHFLIEGHLSTENSSVTETFKRFLQSYNQTFSLQDDGSLVNPVDETIAAEAVLTEKVSRSKKAEKLLNLFSSEKSNGRLMQFVKMIVGNQGKFKKHFELEEDIVLQFSKEEYDEQLETLLGIVGDEYAEVFAAAKQAYEAVELSGILTGTEAATKAKFSASMIQRFDDHREDLKRLKRFIRENFPNKYGEIFKDESAHGYAGYINNSHKTSQAEFYKYLKKLLAGTAGAEYFIEKIDREDFLRKQRTFDNGVIPHQIHLAEMEAILHGQAAYYPFLEDNFAKIKSLLTFRIPYYVGPLASGNSRFAWLSRKSEDPIRPWNLEETVDLPRSATTFIERMTSNDLYLPTEKVLPKHSLLYEKYAVFNELTKVSYMDERGQKQNFSSKEKAQIFTELFKKQRKVSKKLLGQFIENEYGIEAAKIEGIEKNFNSSYGTYHDFIKMGVTVQQLEAPENEPLFEEIVKILTLFEDRKMLEAQLQQYSAHFTAATMKKMMRRHYTGWGRLSAKLLNGIYDRQSQKSILDFLMNDDGPSKHRNRNFMQLINDETLSFKEQIEKEQLGELAADDHELVKNLAGSPAIKKGILQSLKIVDEIVAIMGMPPKNIVVEMPRENQTTTQGKRNAIPRYRALEAAVKEFGSGLLKEYPTDNDALQNDRLYLYYLQNGKDMYTGEDLDIHRLSHYDIDHIVPQNFTTDNSLDNRVLVSSAKNRGKADNVPSIEVVKKMRTFWHSLHKSQLISQRKLDNLTKVERNPEGLTEEDKAGFIQRQLVETRQITKHVAGILHQRYNPAQKAGEESKQSVRIITLKSALTSQFRKTFELYKVRQINDYHHAHDAYLNGVIATTLLKVYPHLAPEFVYGDYRKFNTFKENKATAKKQFYSNLMKFFARTEPIINDDGEILWDSQYIAAVKKVLSYRQMNFTKKLANRATNEKGRELFKATIEGRGGKGKNQIKGRFKRSDGSSIPLPIAKYGGYIEEKEAFITIEQGALKSVKRAEATLYHQAPKIFRNQVYLQKEGFYRTVASLGEASKWNQLCLDQQLSKYIYLLKRYEELSLADKTFVDQHRDAFAKIKELVFNFIEKNQLANVEEIQLPAEPTIEQETTAIMALLNIAARGTTSENSYTILADANTKEQKVLINKRIRYTSKKDKLQLGETILVDYSVTGLYETHRKLGE